MIDFLIGCILVLIVIALLFWVVPRLLLLLIAIIEIVSTANTERKRKRKRRRANKGKVTCDHHDWRTVDGERVRINCTNPASRFRGRTLGQYLCDKHLWSSSYGNTGIVDMDWAKPDIKAKQKMANLYDEALAEERRRNQGRGRIIR